MSALTAQDVRELLDYDPDTGVLVWRLRPRSMFGSDRACNAWNAKNAGKRVDSLHSKGYLSLQINGRAYLAHRVAWLHFYGDWPDGQLDHANRSRMDNSIRNLRQATHAENCRNSSTPINNTSGYKGAYRNPRGRFFAAITVNRKLINLGTYDTPEEAHAVYCEAANRLHGEFACTGGAA